MKKEPCPHCLRRKNICEQQRSKYEWYYRCTNCGLSGPVEVTKEEAIAAWNALPRRLRWTREKPMKNGWYWWRTGGDCNLRGIVSVCIETDIMVLAGSYKYLSQTTGEWAGPIQEPEE